MTYYVAFTFVDHFDRKRFSIEAINAADAAELKAVCDKRVKDSEQSGQLYWKQMSTTEVRSWAFMRILKVLGLQDLYNCKDMSSIGTVLAAVETEWQIATEQAEEFAKIEALVKTEKNAAKLGSLVRKEVCND